MSQPLTLRPDGQLPPHASEVGVYGLCLALPLLFAIVSRTLASYRYRQAARANGKYRPTAPLEVGPTVLRGTIRTAEDTATAMRVVIRQHGKEYKHKSRWHVRWKETQRRVHHHHFTLVCAQGDVQVAPDRNTKVRCWGLTTHKIATAERNRIITLRDGDSIYAVGVLAYSKRPSVGRGYRGGKSLVLRGTADQPLLLSRQPPGEQANGRAKSARLWAMFYVALAILFQATFVMYHLRRFAGTTSVAHVTGTRSVVTHSGRTTRTFHIVTLKLADGDMVEDVFRRQDYHRLQKGVAVAVRGLSWWSGHHRLGALAMANNAHVGMCALIAAVALGVQLWAACGHRPWYEAKLNETTVGRLDD